MRDHNEGKRTEPFFLKNEHEQYAMRISKKTPKDVAHIAYWHTPEINASNGISFVNKGHIDQNIIDSSIKESLMIADDKGELHYVDIKGKNDYQIKSPGNRIPSSNIAITDQFYGEAPDLKNALFHKIEIDYHYEAMPYDEDEDFMPKVYEGKEIEIVDLLGRPREDIVCKIYTQAIKGFPNIKRIILLMGNNDSDEIVCLKYNHVSYMCQKHEMVAVRNKIQLYDGSNNKLTVKGKEKNMMESGFVRILNLRSFMKEVEKADLKTNFEYSAEHTTDGKGYVLSVLPKKEIDPRSGEIFSYIIEAHYKDKFGVKVKKSSGLLFEYTLNKADILPNEKNRYRGNGKTIGIIEGLTILSAREVIQKSMPIDSSLIPDEAVIVIRDGKGELLYYQDIDLDNPKIDTIIDDAGFAASYNPKSNGKWEEGIKPNNLLDEIPHAHRFTLIAEHQANQWAFSYRIDGEGKVPYKITKDFQWYIKAHIAITTKAGSQAVDINDHELWQSFGRADPLIEMVPNPNLCTCGLPLEDHAPSVGGNNRTGKAYFQAVEVPRSIARDAKDLWRLNDNGLNGQKSLSYDGNHEDLIGFYNKQDKNGRDLINELTDYEFSTVVEITDQDDDDAIGIMFRVRDKKNFYMFVWEKEIRNSDPVGVLGIGRVFLGKEGYTHYKFSSEEFDYRYSSNMENYKNNMGYGKKHKRILKASPSQLPLYNSEEFIPNVFVKYPNFMYHQTRFPTDTTGTTFEDITATSGVSTEAIGIKGWETNKKYKVTVQVSGNYFAVYINEGASSSEKGQKVLEGTDPSNTHSRGTYGVAVLSQKDVHWSNMKLTEYKTDSVESDIHTTTLTSKGKKLLIDKKVDVLMHPFIQPLFQQGGKHYGSTYTITSYQGIALGNMSVEVHENSRNIYGKPLDDSVGSESYTTWTTMQENPQLSIVGTGTVTFRDDGSYIIKADHRTIPSIEIPKHVQQFKWREPIITSGDNITVRRKGKTLYFEAKQNEIKEIGRPLKVDEQLIKTTDGVKELFSLSKKDIYALFNIPEHIPLNEIAIRIEKGHILDHSRNSEYASKEMNYRFRVKKDEVYRLIVDQNKGDEGRNRIRLSQVYAKNSRYLNDEFDIAVVGWLVKPKYQTVPVYAVNVKDEYHIMAHPPRVDGNPDNVQAWLPTITNGKLLKRVVLPEIVDDGKDQIVYKRYPQLKQFASTPDKQEELEVVYTIPEYERMNFVRPGIKESNREVPRFITSNIIQVKNKNILTDHEVTSPHHKVTAIKNNQRVDIGIKDIDSENGIIFLREHLDEENEPLVSYSYIEKDYIYPGFINENSTLLMESKPYPIRGNSLIKLKVWAENEYPLDAPWFVMLTPSQSLLNIRQLGDHLVVKIQLRDKYHLDGYHIKLDGELVDHDENMPFDITSHNAKDIIIPLKKIRSNSEAKADIIFMLDVTGSMNSHIKKIGDEINAFIELLQNEGINWRAAVVMYGDTLTGEYTNNRPYRSSATEVRSDIEGITSKTTHLYTHNTLYPPRHEREWGRWNGKGNNGENTFETLFDPEYGPASYQKRENANKHVIIISDEPIHTKDFIPGMAPSLTARANYTLQEGLDEMAETNDFYHLICITDSEDFMSHGFRDIMNDPRIKSTQEDIYKDSYDFVKLKDQIVQSAKLENEYYTIDVDVQNKAGISHSGKIELRLEDMDGDI